MKSFTYTIKDELGIHARPAGQVVSEAKKYNSIITIDAGEKKANATRLMAVMALGVKCGQTVTVTAEGVDEDAAIEGIQQFFETTL
ncbi:MAG: HPr family phosphocarrier protein [Lachnospiraceae bacterium]|nr:HPr family phosphocarrier protein [Lachnospiraceae bacterium]